MARKKRAPKQQARRQPQRRPTARSKAAPALNPDASEEVDESGALSGEVEKERASGAEAPVTSTELAEGEAPLGDTTASDTAAELDGAPARAESDEADRNAPEQGVDEGAPVEDGESEDAELGASTEERSADEEASGDEEPRELPAEPAEEEAVSDEPARDAELDATADDSAAADDGERPGEYARGGSGEAFTGERAADDGMDPEGADVEELDGAQEGVEEGMGLVGEGVEADDSQVEDTESFLKGMVEAILFVSDRPLSVQEVARAAKIDKKRAGELIALLQEESAHRGIRLVEVSQGFAFRTSPVYSAQVRGFLAQRPVRLSRAQLETLAIIAYRQPITRPEVDDIRGVDSGQVIKGLLERELIRILGKKDEPGRPMLYGTTPQFLDLFSLTSLRDLPTLKEFTELSEESRLTFEAEIGEAAPTGPIEFPEEGAEEAAEKDAEASGSDRDGSESGPGLEGEDDGAREGAESDEAEARQSADVSDDDDADDDDDDDADDDDADDDDADDDDDDD